MAKVGQLVFGTATGRYVIVLLLGVGVFALLASRLAADTAWAYFTLAVMALVPAALFLTSRRVDHLFGLAVLALLMGGVYLLDRYQESDTEQVLRKTHELLRAVEQSDYGVFERHIASNFQWAGMDKPGILRRARSSLPPGNHRSCGMSGERVRVDNYSPTLKVEGNLVANGQFGSENGTFLGTIELTYARQPSGEYQVTGARVAWHNGMEVTIPR